MQPTPVITPAPTPEPEPWPEFSEATLDFYASQAGWPVELRDELREVVRCESTFRPRADNHTGNYGLLQLSRLWFDYADYDFELWADPLVNLRVGYLTYLYDIKVGNPPWYQWSCKP
jgi:hypothetical protein